MWRCALVLVVAACMDTPSLHVTVTHPTGLAIARTELAVYESSSLTCDDIAFARIGADELAAIAAIAQVIEGSGEAALANLTRTGRKVIVARGLAAGGQLLAAGCTTQELVEGRVELELATIAAATASVLSTQDPADPTAIAMVTTDPHGRALDGRRVSWTVYGPAGATPMQPGTVELGDGVWEPPGPTCSTAGLVRVHPVPSAVVGGYAIQLRVEWATQQPPRTTSLLAPDFTPQSSNPPSPGARFCALRVRDANRWLVCLERDGSDVIARAFRAQVSAGRAGLVGVDEQPVAGDAIAVVSVPDDGGLEVYAITTRGELLPLFAAPTIANAAPVCPAGPPCATPVENALVLPACGPAQGAKLVLQLGGAGGPGQIKQVDLSDGSLGDLPLNRLATLRVVLDNAGCVQRLAPMGGAAEPQQVISYHLTGLVEPIILQTRMSYGCAVTCDDIELLAGAGVGFVPGAEPRAVITILDATGVVLVQAVMIPDPTGKPDRLVERTRHPAAALPDRMVTGRFDADDTWDLIWSMAAQRGTRFELAYGKQAGGQPLLALSPLVARQYGTLLAGDLTGDGFDDLIVTGAQGGAGVVPMFVPAAPLDVASDPPCAP
jgi:hypothetical protein